MAKVLTNEYIKNERLTEERDEWKEASIKWMSDCEMARYEPTDLVKVKELEWEYVWGRWAGENYTINQYPEPDGTKVYYALWRGARRVHETNGYPTLEDAQAACQADPPTAKSILQKARC